MKNFIDTNIALGYSFPCDKWHEPSLKFISENNNIFWSNKVKKEFNEKFDEISKEIHKFLSKISVILSMDQKSFVNYSSFEKFILNKTKSCKIDITKKIRIIEFFWENKNISFEDFPIELLIKLNSFILHYKHDHKKNKHQLETIVTLHDCGLNNYLNYHAINEKLKNLGIHEPDDIIVIDAHDLGLKFDFCFNTIDRKLFELINESDFLSIKEFKLVN